MNKISKVYETKKGSAFANLYGDWYKLILKYSDTTSYPSRELDDQMESDIASFREKWGNPPFIDFFVNGVRYTYYTYKGLTLLGDTSGKVTPRINHEIEGISLFLQELWSSAIVPYINGNENGLFTEKIWGDLMDTVSTIGQKYKYLPIVQLGFIILDFLYWRDKSGIEEAV